MTKYLTFLLLFILSTAVMAENPLGKSLLLKYHYNYFEIPDNGTHVFGNDRDITIEVRFKRFSDEQCNLFNKYIVDTQQDTSSKYYYDWGYKNTGWFINLNRVGNHFHPDLLLTTTANIDQYKLIDSRPGGVCLLYSGGGYSGNGSRRQAPFKKNEWNHFAFVRDYRGCKLKGNLYLNGVSFDNENSSPSSCDYEVEGVSLNFGGFSKDVDTLILENTLCFDGYLDEIRIWNIARTEEQISGMMNDTLGPEYYQTTESGLVAYYRFDEAENLGIGDDGLKNDIRDLSVYANHGTIHGEFRLDETEFEMISAKASRKVHKKGQPPMTIDFELTRPQPVSLTVINQLGNIVRRTWEEEMFPGEKQLTIDRNSLDEGQYMYRLVTEEFTQKGKFVVE